MTEEQPEIASREEVLQMLTEKARKGQTGAMIALERALRGQSQRARGPARRGSVDRLLRK